MRSLSSVLRNLTRGDLPLASRARLVAASCVRRILRRQACCGRPGEPGC